MSRPLVFTASEVAPRWDVSEKRAEEILEGFRAAGLVVRVVDGWRVTRAGFILSVSCALWRPEEVVDQSRPARHRKAVRA